MPSECRGCDYVFHPLCDVYYCQYIVKTGHRRPCKAGKGCTVRKTDGLVEIPFVIKLPPVKRERRHAEPKWHRAAAEMYAEGKSDGEIGRALEMPPKTIQSWRKRTGRPAIAKGGRPKGEAGK